MINNLVSPKRTKKTNFGDKIGKNLRESHYILGKDELNPISEYRFEYVPKRGEIDPVNNAFLRSSHFVLGNSPLNYLTSSQEQSESIPKKILPGQINLQNLKTKFQGSNFILGNAENDYTTDYQSKYINKSNLFPLNNEEKEFIKYKNKKTNIIPGNDKVEYNSETSSKYTKPEIEYSQIFKDKNKLSLSTQELQKGHIGQFGNFPLSYSTTNRAIFTPKYSMENNRYINPNLQMSHIILGKNDDEKKGYKSESMISYNYKPLINNSLDSDTLNNLRSSHFNLGNDFSPDIMNTINRREFQDPKNSKNYFLYKNNEKMDPLKYQKTNWSLSAGDINDYKSAYNKMMTPKIISKKTFEDIEKNRLHTYKSSIIISHGDNNNYLSEYKKHYNKGLVYNEKEDKKNREDINLITNFIKNSHVKLGDNKNDYITTNQGNYRYDSNIAKKSRGMLDSALLNNLQCTHYEIGKNNAPLEQSTNRHDYIAYPNFKSKNIAATMVRTRSDVTLGNEYQNKFKGESIYMSDYIEKELPDSDYPGNFL